MDPNIKNDLINAAITCNAVVDAMQKDEIVRNTPGMLEIIAMSLVGINQVLIAIAEAIIDGREEADGQD